MSESIEKTYVALIKEVDGNNYYTHYTSDLKGLYTWAFISGNMLSNIKEIVLYEIENLSKKNRYDIVESLESIKENFLINSNLNLKEIREKEYELNKIKILNDEDLNNIKRREILKI